MQSPRGTVKVKSPIHGRMRLVLVVGVCSYYIKKHSIGQSYFFPHGLPVPVPKENRLEWATPDKTNDILQSKRKIGQSIFFCFFLFVVFLSVMFFGSSSPDRLKSY